MEGSSVAPQEAHYVESYLDALEQENAALKQENADLRRQLQEYKEQKDKMEAELHECLITMMKKVKT